MTNDTWTAYFGFDSSDLTQEAVDVLGAVADHYRQFPSRLMLTAHTNTTYGAPYNFGLSRNMSDAVKFCLIAKGVPKTAIRSESWGDRRLPVPDASGDDPLNRRVDIRIDDS